MDMFKAFFLSFFFPSFPLLFSLTVMGDGKHLGLFVLFYEAFDLFAYFTFYYEKFPAYTKV